MPTNWLPWKSGVQLGLQQSCMNGLTQDSLSLGMGKGIFSLKSQAQATPLTNLRG